MRERDLVQQVRDLLRCLGAWECKLHGHLGQRRGLPDIVACLDGIFIAIECKGRHGRLSPAQVAELSDLERAKAVVLVAYSLEDVVDMLRQRFPYLAGRIAQIWGPGVNAAGRVGRRRR